MWINKLPFQKHLEESDTCLFIVSGTLTYKIFPFLEHVSLMSSMIAIRSVPRGNVCT